MVYVLTSGFEAQQSETITKRHLLEKSHISTSVVTIVTIRTTYVPKAGAQQNMNAVMMMDMMNTDLLSLWSRIFNLEFFARLIRLLGVAHTRHRSTPWLVLGMATLQFAQR